MMKKILNKIFNQVTISFGITVCNEVEELKVILENLLSEIERNDEIIILQDCTNENKDVSMLIESYKPKVKHIRSKLNGDFATFKNILIDCSKKKYLFQIDADEYLNKNAIKKIRKILKEQYKTEVFNVPRINLVDGITNELIEKWNWKLNQKNYINFPDFQQRIFKLNGKIKWKNKVHEILVGNKNIDNLPLNNEDYCLIHKKTIYKQMSQNEFYDKL